MRQDVDGTMSADEARERGYLPTAEVPALIGVTRDLRELGRTMRREGLRPVRIGHAYWWNAAAVLEWAAQRRWIRAQGSDPVPCSAQGCGRDAVSHGLCLRHYKAARGKYAGEYREAYELPRSTKLAAVSVRERISRSSSKPEALTRLAGVRDPQAAASARTDDTFRAVSRAQRARNADG